LSSFEEDTDINDQNIYDDNEEDDIGTYSEKSVKNGEQVVVFGNTLNVVGGIFRMIMFVMCV
jgi:hypothetical protein